MNYVGVEKLMFDGLSAAYKIVRATVKTAIAIDEANESRKRTAETIKQTKELKKQTEIMKAENAKRIEESRKRTEYMRELATKELANMTDMEKAEVEVYGMLTKINDRLYPYN